MKKSVALIAAFLAASLLSFSSQAEELEIESTSGASLGKWKYDEIDPSDALLEVGLDGRRLISVEAGYIGNDSYTELWRFDNSFLLYDKLSSDSFYLESVFNEKDAAKSFCGADVEQNCDDLKTNKRSRNLIVVTYRDRRTGAACAGLDYIDEENYSEGYGASYGDYNVRLTTCIPASDDHEEALALSAHYLSLVKKDGRPIARLSRYDLPKPSTQARAPTPAPVSQPVAKHDVELGASDARVCTMATGYGDWQKYRAYELWVAEAHKRALSLEDCETLLKAN